MRGVGKSAARKPRSQAREELGTGDAQPWQEDARLGKRIAASETELTFAPITLAQDARHASRDADPGCLRLSQPLLQTHRAQAVAIGLAWRQL